MSQKIVIPKGTIDPTHTTIIEIPNYLHEAMTVVVTTPKTADPALEENWQQNDYNSYTPDNDAEQDAAEEIYDQNVEATESNDEQDYSSVQQENAEYMPATRNTDRTRELQKFTRSYVNNPEEAPERFSEKPNNEMFYQDMKRMMAHKRRELTKSKAERRHMMEGRYSAYETVPLGRDMEGQAILSEVPESMRGRSTTRENNMEKENKRRQQEFAKYEHYVNPIPACYQPTNKGQNYNAYTGDVSNQQIYYPQPDTQQYADTYGYPDVQHAYQYQARPQIPQSQLRRSPTAQMDYGVEDTRQYEKIRKSVTYQ